MAKKDTKRVSISAWEKVMKEHFGSEPTKVEWNGIELEIKKVLPLKEVLIFVHDIVEACFSEEGTFLPEAEQFAIKSGVLAHYAGFAMPENLEKQYELVMNTNAYDVVVEYVDEDQLQDIIDSADRKVDYMCDSNAMAIKAEAEKVVAEFQKLGENLEAMFGDMSADDIKKLLSAVGDLGEVNEEKIVEAYANHMQGDEEAPQSDGEAE